VQTLYNRCDAMCPIGMMGVQRHISQHTWVGIMGRGLGLQVAVPPPTARGETSVPLKTSAFACL
jgi:hypothetical protein